MEHTEKTHSLAVAARFVRMKWGRPIRVAGGGLVIGALSLTLVGFRPFDSPRKGKQAPLPATVTAAGTVESLLVKQVGSPFDGEVERMLVRTGQQVKKGQLLFELDTASFKHDLSLAREAMKTAMAEYRGGRSQRDAEMAGLRRQIETLEASIRQERERAASVEQQPAVPEDAEAAPVEAAAETAPYDPARLPELEAQVGTARAQVKEQAHAWDANLYQTWLSYQEAKREAGRLEKLIAGAERRSPMDGVVTEVATAPGKWVEAYKPVVRVDNPNGYRVVTLVEEQFRDELEPGITLATQRPDGQAAGRLEKIEQGWDKELYQYWLWLKPERPENLMPGQTVSVSVPTPVSLVASN